jgi:hypothetical protein
VLAYKHETVRSYTDQLPAVNSVPVRHDKRTPRQNHSLELGFRTGIGLMPVYLFPMAAFCHGGPCKLLIQQFQRHLNCFLIGRKYK